MVSDINKGMSILNRRHERWGDHNLMELSYVGQLRAFIASKSIIFVSKEIFATQEFLQCTAAHWFCAPINPLIAQMLWGAFLLYLTNSKCLRSGAKANTYTIHIAIHSPVKRAFARYLPYTLFIQMCFGICECCQKWGFGNVNFVKNEILW